MNLVLAASKDTSYKRQMFAERKLKKIEKGLLERNIYVMESVQIYSLFKYIDDSHFLNFIFLDENYEIVNQLTEVEFYQKIGLL